MNKHLHRVIFNKARGLLMVVAENVSSQGKAPGTREASGTSGSWVATLAPLRFALMGALGLVSLATIPAWANGIVADPNAPGGQRPNVMESANGTPQVNIAAPSAAGVSRNNYSQFDVDGRGAILNNSPTNSQTQLGGWIEGNPNLSGSARVILNEVNSSNPSQLRGYVEVAGRRAEVVIANPAGITCDGCGFINADRSTLTTGRVQMEDGRITGYKVEGGTLNITGRGLDSRDSDYTDLIARSVEVNAGIWAKDLKVTAGRNQVSADNSQASALADDGSDKPEVAIDVAQLGGMYAGKIKLVGTEAGVGVRNAGQIGAMAGDVVIGADGKLQNLGAISSAGDTRVASNQSIDNSGSLYAKGDTRLSSQTTIDNTGVVAAQGKTSLEADRVRSSGESLLASGIDAQGNSGAAADLEIKARHVAANGQNHASGKLDIEADNLDLSHSRTRSTDLSLNARNGDLDLSASQIDSTGTLQASASGTLRSDAASVSAEQLTLSARHLSNVGGELLQTGTAASTLKATDSLDNSAGRIASNAQTLSLEAQTLSNRGGKVEHAGDGRLALNAQRIEGSGGSLLSNGELQLNAQQVVLADGHSQGRQVLIDSRELDNRGGTLLATDGGLLEVRGAQRLDNSGGSIASNGEVRLTAQELLNGGGELLSGRLLSLNAAYLRGNGRALSLGDLLLRQQGDMSLAGQMQANGKLDIEAGGTLNNAGQLQAGQSLLLRSAALNNSSGAELSANQVDLRVTGQLLNRGLVDGQLVRVQADEVHNLGTGQLYGDRLAIASRLLSNRDEGGRAATLAARERLDIGTQTLENREQALIFSAGDLAIGGALDANDRASGRADLLSNASATIESLGNLDLAVGELRNTNEHFSTAQVEVSREQLQEYQISGSPNRYRPDQVSVHNDEVDHLTTPDGRRDNFNRYDYERTVTETRVLTSAPGQILAGGNLSFSGDSVLNDKSRIIAGGLLQVGATQVTNVEADGQRVISDAGTATNFYRIQRKGRDRQGTNVTAYTPAPLIQDIDISPTEFRAQTAVNGSNTQLAAHQSVQIDPGVEVQLNNGQGVADLVRTGGLNLTLPSNNLFQTNPEGTRGYLIETDPRFASYRQWLSSDYMLQRLNVDPALTQQRLGDGFYEQKLIREQIALLTGRRFLDGYADDEAQYRALIDNAVTLASEWNLVPGVALTAEQMAQLTSDVVWLVERSVTLANGESRKVLVPQVYVRVRDGDLNGNGALIAGQQLKLDLSGDLLNSGSIGGRSIVSLNARNIENLGGRIQADRAALIARDDLNNTGGVIGARDSLLVQAGNDVNLNAVTQDSSSVQGSRTSLSRVAGLFVSGDAGTLQVSAGNDINLNAAQLLNAGRGGVTRLEAGRDLNLGTASESHQQMVRWNDSNWRNESSHTEVGSTIQGTGNLLLSAGQDINARGATVRSEQGMLLAEASRDIRIEAAEQQQFVDEAHRFKGRSGMFSSKTTTLRDTVDRTQAQGSTFSADQLYLNADRDIGVRGSDLVSSRQTQLQAGRDVDLTAASEYNQERHDQSVKKSGLFSGGGLSLTIGTQRQSVSDRSDGQSARASTLGSTAGNVIIEAGNSYRQSGSHVMTPTGDVNVLAEQIAITEAREIGRQEQETKFKQSGLSVGLNVPVINALQSTHRLVKATSEVKDDRMKALGGAMAALTAYNTGSGISAAVKEGDPSKAGGFGINISIGSSSSQSNTTYTSDSAAGSSIKAGGNVTLVATGAGEDSNILVRGSEIAAGRDATLIADNRIDLVAAQNQLSQHTTESSRSASLGVGLNFGGQQNGLSFNAAVSRGRGQADGEDLTHTNSLVSAGDTALLISGGDTSIRGAQVAGQSVKAQVGGDLLVESLQDTSTYASQQKNTGAGLSLCIPPFCVGTPVSGNLSLAKSKSNGDYASVVEQSGIRAGDGGFELEVQGNTDLKGAVIASTQAAIDADANRLTTGTLTTSDLDNRASASARSSGVDLSSDMLTQGKYGLSKAVIGTALNKGDARESDSGRTLAAVSGGAIEIRDEQGQLDKTGKSTEETIATLNRDVAGSHIGVERLDPKELEKQAEAERIIKNAVAVEAFKFSDDAYRTMFVKEHPMYEVMLNEDGSVKMENEKPVLRLLSNEEKLALKAGPDGRIRIGVNGIFNDENAAAGYAAQHNEGRAAPLYIVSFPQASNAVAELMVAGYQKHLENEFWGLSRSTAEITDLLRHYGTQGLELDAHSRGSMTVGNALEALKNGNAAAGTLSETYLKFFGPAYNAEKAASLLYQLSGGAQDTVSLQNHRDDFVGSIIGGNPATHDQVGAGSTKVKEWLNMFGGTATVHNCYGASSTRNGCGAYGTPNTLDIKAKTRP
ncbi:hemagglutinin repeat-containing protein [Pseudomonas sp. G34]|uniref:two-partner secretion domain-containing protein n=1 Tax=Pseudomonas sp. G34 TaxID=3059083 RepID=UPI002808CB25|nr:hemagglutinin repeat-containing protein [Pseudomonas sp. G34]MDQ7985135.1 hemagglutinin repeat-containing protein [Pseudomonas sp. G34]